MPATRSPQFRREDLAPGECLCDHCAGKCCQYYSLPVEKPAAWDDFDALAHYLRHRRTLVYVHRETWYLLVNDRCGYLQPDNRCGIYLDRPKICREYTTDDCEYDEDWSFDRVFSAPEQVMDYADAILPPRSRPATPRAARGGFVLGIEAPTTRDDYDAIRWYLAHGRTAVATAGGKWYLLVRTGLRTRPLPSATRALADWQAEGWRFDRFFPSPATLWEYAEAVLPPRPRRAAAPVEFVEIGPAPAAGVRPK